MFDRATLQSYSRLCLRPLCATYRTSSPPRPRPPRRRDRSRRGEIPPLRDTLQLQSSSSSSSGSFNSLHMRHMCRLVFFLPGNIATRPVPLNRGVSSGPCGLRRWRQSDAADAGEESPSSDRRRSEVELCCSGLRASAELQDVDFLVLHQDPAAVTPGPTRASSEGAFCLCSPLRPSSDLLLKCVFCFFFLRFDPRWTANTSAFTPTCSDASSEAPFRSEDNCDVTVGGAQFALLGSLSTG